MDASATIARPASDLSDLELSEDEKAAEEAAEAERIERYASRRLELLEFDDETLAVIAGEEALGLDRDVAEGLIAERAADESGAAGDGKGEELRENAGEPVGAMPAADPEALVIPPDQILVKGAHESGRKWSGKAPTTTILEVKGIKVQVDGSFRKGERIRFSGVGVVMAETAQDKLDKSTKAVTESVETFKAQVLDFELLEG